MRTLNIITRQKHKAMWCVWFRGAMAYITLPALATLLYIHISSQHSTRTECSEDSGRVFVRQVFFPSRQYICSIFISLPNLMRATIQKRTEND